MKKHLKVIFIFTFLFLNRDTQAQHTLDNNFQEANNFYAKNKFDKALELYLRLEKVGYVSPELFYNIGNTYFKLKNIPYAILYYERSIKKYGPDEDVQHNLLLAQTKIVDRPETEPMLWPVKLTQSLIMQCSETQWTWISITMSIIIALVLYLMIISQVPKRKKLLYQINIVLIILMLLILYLGNKRKKIAYNDKEGIIIGTTVNAYSAPNEESANLFIIHEGLKVKIENTENNWVKIKINDQKIGWIPQELVKKI